MRAERAPLRIAGAVVRLTKHQCELLFAVAERAHEPVSIDRMLLSVYGRRLASAFLGSDDWANLRALAYRINGICRAAGVGNVIEFVPGAGYRLAEGINIPTECEQVFWGKNTNPHDPHENMRRLGGAPTTGARA